MSPDSFSTVETVYTDVLRKCKTPPGCTKRMKCAAVGGSRFTDVMELICGTWRSRTLGRSCLVSGCLQVPSGSGKGPVPCVSHNCCLKLVWTAHVSWLARPRRWCNTQGGTISEQNGCDVDCQPHRRKYAVQKRRIFTRYTLLTMEKRWSRPGFFWR